MPFASKKGTAGAKRPEAKHKAAQKPGRKAQQKNTRQQPPAPTAQGYRVVISGLPERLMSTPMMMVMVENAIAKEDVLSIDVVSAYKQGQAFIDCKNAMTALKLVEHCHGCNWNPAGPKVTAALQDDSTCQSEQVPPKSAVSVPTHEAAWFGKFGFEQYGFDQYGSPQTQHSVQHLVKETPAYVHIWDHGNRPPIVNSDASTNVSDSESRGE